MPNAESRAISKSMKREFNEEINQDVDVVVIGGGVAGLSGALMLARSRRSVVVIDSGEPRNAPAAGVHGLIGREGISPEQLLRISRAEVQSYGAEVVAGKVVAVEPFEHGSGARRFIVTLHTGGTFTARRILITTGVRDELPEIPGLVKQWGRGVVHCPYCHGWEVRDKPIGVIATSPASVHQALLFRQLSADLIYFTMGEALDAQTRDRFAAREIRIIETPISAVESSDDAITGVRLVDGQRIEREVLTVGTVTHARDDGIEALGLPREELPNGLGQYFATGQAGTTSIPGVWVAGNAAEPFAQVGAAAAAAALAGAHINADLVSEDTDKAVSSRA